MTRRDASTKLGQVLIQTEKLVQGKSKTDQEVEQIIFDTSITDDEMNLIHAYIVYDVIERLEETKHEKAAARLRKELRPGGKFDWCVSWENEFNLPSAKKGKTKIQYAIKHLQKVTDNLQKSKYKEVYCHSWLLLWDEVLYEKMIEWEEKYNGKRRRTTSSFSSNYS